MTRTLEGGRIIGCYCGGGFQYYYMARIEYVSGDVYTGPVDQSIRHGSNGTLQWRDGRCYQGDWHHGERHGRGVYTWPAVSAATDGDSDEEWIDSAGGYL